MKKTDYFTGFTSATFQFLKDLRDNNYKIWFDEHKPVYEKELLQPLKGLILAMTPPMYEIDNQIDFRNNRVLSRIYRDVRFSADKRPYKDHMWMTFQRLVPEWENFPAFFFEIHPEGYRYGMGLYGSKKKIMDSFRSKIEYEPDHFREITQDLTTKYEFLLEGESYVRPLKNDLPEYFQPWTQRKSTYLIKNCPIGKELFDEGFVQVLVKDFQVMTPLYDFFADACDL